ncbi:MAG TPA: diguanylate cyclase [candidate division Zixibacteria bacterium]|nr:diguanylate cyclase [candidate division Zixibacteria bacterium]
MEFRSLLRILLHRWWLLVPVFVLTFGSAVAFTYSQERVYQSTATYLVKPSPGFADEIFTALNMVARQPEIAETYAQLALSRSVRAEANEMLEVTPEELRTLKVSSRLVPGTTLIELSVESTDPQLAADYTAVLGASLIDYLNDVYEVFELVLIDPAVVGTTPVRPNVPLNLLLGAAIALVAAVGVGFLAETLRSSTPGQPQTEIVDRESWAYNHTYFMLRLSEEMSRTRRTGRPVAVGVMNVNHGRALEGPAPRQRAEAIRRIATLLNTHVRTEDVVARLDDWTFGLLLVDTDEKEAMDLIEGMRARLSVPVLGSTDRGEAIRVHPAAGLSAFKGNETVSDVELVERARRALHQAELVPVGKTAAFSSIGAAGAS